MNNAAPVLDIRSTVLPLSTKLGAFPAVRTATRDDAQRCFAVLARAFERDAPCRWMWPDERQYCRAFPRFAAAFGGAAIGLGTAHYYDGFAGCALWLSPGAPMDEQTLEEIINETVSPERHDAAFEFFSQMDRYHPSGPHWHLPLIGVDPVHQGRGIGSALLRHVLDQCDREQLPAHLEATSPANIRLYSRHGFEELGCIQVEDCPPIVPMQRRPR